MHVHAPNDWDATTGAGWETGGGRGGGSGSGVLFAGPQVALSSAAGGSCDVPGRPDIGGPGSCFVSLCTSWSKPRLGALGVLKNAVSAPESKSGKFLELAYRRTSALPWPWGWGVELPAPRKPPAPPPPPP